MKLTNLTEKYSDRYKNQPIYCLENEQKLQVGLIPLGAAILFVHMPDARGIVRNIALSLQHLSDYIAGAICAGATVGPVAGRIGGGRLSIEGKVYTLPKNDGENTLHSGPQNLGNTLWEVKDTFCNAEEAGILFAQHLFDGQNGLPGERDVTVRYTLTSNGTLNIQYTAGSDKTTWMNLTNHTYWNLTGDFTQPADRQVLQVNADTVYYNDASHLPVSCEDVAETPFDFTIPRTVAAAVQRNPDHPQLQNALGYNNAFLLRQDGQPAAVLSDPESGRRVTVSTDYPSLVFYSGGYLGDAGYTMEDKKISASGAYALEAQYLPDAPRLLGSTTPFLKPGEMYKKTISFYFDCVN